MKKLKMEAERKQDVVSVSAMNKNSAIQFGKTERIELVKTLWCFLKTDSSVHFCYLDWSFNCTSKP